MKDIIKLSTFIRASLAVIFTVALAVHHDTLDWHWTAAALVWWITMAYIFAKEFDDPWEIIFAP